MKIEKTKLKNNFSDFVFYNYSIEEFLEVARTEDDPTIVRDREMVRKMFEVKYAYYQKRSDDMTCVGRVIKLPYPSKIFFFLENL